MSDDGLVGQAWLGTAVFSVVAAAGALFPDSVAVPVVVVDLLLFAWGCAAFVQTLLKVADRSRTEELSLGGIWWLQGSPGDVRRALLGALWAQIAVALGTASIRPFTARAFGVLVPVHALGLAGLWAARHADFPPRRQR